MDFTNYIGQSSECLHEAAEQAFGLRDFVRMSGNRFDGDGCETALYAELDKACESFKAELINRHHWERFATSLGMDI